MTNPFPAAAIKAFAPGASPAERKAFATASAQRALVIAEDAVGQLRPDDEAILTTALQACWESVQSDASSEAAEATAAGLMDQLVDEDDDEYGFYNSAVNDVLTATIYATRSGAGQQASESALYAAQTFFNIVDLLLQRNRPDYVDDLAGQPMMEYAANCILNDIDRVGNIVTAGTVDEYRSACITEGRHISELNDKK